MSYEVPETNVRAGSGAACGSARLYPGRHPSDDDRPKARRQPFELPFAFGYVSGCTCGVVGSVSRMAGDMGCRSGMASGPRGGSASGGACFARGRMGGERGHAGLHHRQVAADPRPARLDRSPRAVVVRTNLLEDSQHALGTLARPDSEQLVVVESRLFSRHSVTLLGPTPKFTCKGTKSTRAARPRAIHSVQRRVA